MNAIFRQHAGKWHFFVIGQTGEESYLASSLAFILELPHPPHLDQHPVQTPKMA